MSQDWIRGVLNCIVLLLNTLVCTILVYIVVIFKLLIPSVAFKKACTQGLVWISERWVAINRTLFGLLQNTRWEVTGLEESGISRDKWYFLISNHQSATDIFVLLHLLSGQISPFKFFIKQALFWVPLAGLVWWAIDCPFMKRYSKEALEKNPSLREIDMQTTQKKCLKFRDYPVTIFSFIEGTRLTSKKQEAQKSGFKHLLNPKAGSLAYALNAMNGKIRDLIDVTIVYPKGKQSLWDYLCGRIDIIKVHVEVKPIPSEILIGDYLHDPHYRATLKQWLISIWSRKDRLISELMSESSD